LVSRAWWSTACIMSLTNDSLGIPARAAASYRRRAIMRHSPAASAATTGPDGTATPSVRLQGALRGRSRPRSQQAADRSVNAPRSPVLRPSPTGIEGRRYKLQASLSFGHLPAARPAVCGGPRYLFEAEL